MAAPLQGRRVTIEGIQAKPELNGLTGTAVSFDDAKGRYNVKLDQGETVAIKPANLRAQPEGGAGGGGMPGM
eukprot:4958718-Prymnesium_polylepis.2